MELVILPTKSAANLFNRGLDAKTNVTLRYTGSPMEVVQFLASGRVDAALLPEPTATTVILSRGKITTSYPAPPTSGSPGAPSPTPRRSYPKRA